MSGSSTAAAVVDSHDTAIRGKLSGLRARRKMRGRLQLYTIFHCRTGRSRQPHSQGFRSCRRFVQEQEAEVAIVWVRHSWEPAVFWVVVRMREAHSRRRLQ